MRGLFKSPLGASAPPQAPDKLYIAPVVAAALIAGGSALVGTAANTISQANSNNANRDIADATNATNMKINREQIAAQQALYNSQVAENRYLVNQAYQRELENREYNSPKNVRDRYLQAGINPLLAGQFGSVSGSSNMTIPTGQVPSSSTPNLIPAQNGEPVHPLNFDGIGLAAQNAINTYFNSKADDRADYALANDITVSRLNAQSKFIEATTKAKEAGVNEKWINSEIEEAERRYWLDVDKNAVEKEDRERARAIEEKTNDIRAYEAETNRLLAQANIKLSAAQVNRLAQEVIESKERVTQMIKDGESRRAIESWIHDKEMYLTNVLSREWNILKGRDSEGLTEWEMIVGGLLSPVKGLVNVGIHN